MFFLNKKVFLLLFNTFTLLYFLSFYALGLEEDEDALLLQQLKVVYLSESKQWPYVGNPDYLKKKWELPLWHYYNSMATFPGANKTFPHGLLGFYPNMTRAYIPGPIPPPLTAENETEILANGGFYKALSDALPLDREPLDMRSNACKQVVYDLSSLDDVSVIINFYNEPVSTLLRTIHSLLNHTPPPLLREIILVDDHSDLPDLLPGNFLTKYLTLLPKVKLIRHPERRGLVMARLSGIRMAKAPIIVVLDSHLEFASGWLEPQLERIKQSPTSLVFPQIPSLNSKTFEYMANVGIGTIINFKWIMQERSFGLVVPQSTDAIPSPSMAGGLFAVRKDVFWNLGGYDEEFTMWGAENVEMGFRYWLCHHRVESTPCSFVFHIYRLNPSTAILKNRLRTSRLWTDQYHSLTEFMLNAKPNQVDLGSFDQILELKERLKCHDFEWYLKNVAKEHPLSTLSNIVYIYRIQNVGLPPYCLDTFSAEPSDTRFSVFGCHDEGKRQSFLYDKETHFLVSVINEWFCLDTSFKMVHCGDRKNQAGWLIDDPYIRSSASPHLCLNVVTSSKEYELNFIDCNSTTNTHLWKITRKNFPSSITPLKYSKEYLKDSHITFFN